MPALQTRWIALLLPLTLAGCGDNGSPADQQSPPMDMTTAATTDQSQSQSPMDSAFVPDSWSNFAQTFFGTYCVHCHGPNTADKARDYSQYSQVQRDASVIACGVNPGPNPLPNCAAFPPPRQFPIAAPYPTDDERSRIVNWIAAGLPQ